MKPATRQRTDASRPTVRILGRGVRAQRGVHLTLRALREAVGKTQGEMSELTGIDQGDISRLETRENLDECLVSTLQRYLAALGGRLEVTAVFGDKKIIVVGSASASVAGKRGGTATQRTTRRAARR